MCICKKGMYKRTLINSIESKIGKGKTILFVGPRQVGKTTLIKKLIQALAFQLGSKLNYNELAQIVGVDKNTVSNYIGILEKGYVIFKLNSFSRNLRNEIKKTEKYVSMIMALE